MKTSYLVSYQVRNFPFWLEGKHATLYSANVHYNELKSQPNVSKIKVQKITLVRKS